MTQISYSMSEKFERQLIIRLEMSKYDICKHLHDQGDTKFITPSGKTNTKRLWNTINNNPTLKKKLKWKNKQRYRKVYSSDFSQRETEILIKELKLYELK